MMISDSIVREALADVYWITGGACAGKTTVTEVLSQKHGFTVFPDRISEYQTRADLQAMPAMRYPRPGTDWEWFFNRPVDEYVTWLEDVARCVLEFIVVDLIKETRTRPVIVEQFAEPSATMSIAATGSVALMFAEEELVRSDLLHRDDHGMILECIEAHTRDPRTAEANVVAASVEIARRRREWTTHAGIPVLTREGATRPEELVWQVEECFGLEH